MIIKRGIIAIFLLLAALSGCKALVFPFALLSDNKVKVKAEYRGLEEHLTAIVVAASQGMEFEYPRARLNVALATGYEITQKVKNTAFVEQEKIDIFQREDLDWLSLPMSEVGKRFEAQRVLYIDLIEYTTREEDSINLLRGRITADVRVYEMDHAHPDQPVYQTEVTVVFPEKAPVPVSDEVTRLHLEAQTVYKIAEEIARKFYDHKVDARK